VAVKTSRNQILYDDEAGRGSHNRAYVTPEAAVSHQRRKQTGGGQNMRLYLVISGDGIFDGTRPSHWPVGLQRLLHLSAGN